MLNWLLSEYGPTREHEVNPPLQDLHARAHGVARPRRATLRTNGCRGKHALVVETIFNFIVRYPHRTVDPILDICALAVRDTPFVILYDYDDQELRIHLIIPREPRSDGH